MMDVAELRKQFPALSRQIGGRPIIYFDNAASTMKLNSVIEAVSNYYRLNGANVHRGKHYLSEEVSEAFERCRQKVAGFIGATTSEIIFTRGTTEAINLVAAGLNWSENSNVVCSVSEHHANILPWRQKAEVRFVPLDSQGLPDASKIDALIDQNTRMISVILCSNVTGATTKIDQWVACARKHNLPILVDAAQSMSHMTIDVEKIDCDYLVFSGHKMFGPTGVGVLYGKKAQLSELKPLIYGGGAVSLVDEKGNGKLRDLPWRLEAGTPDIASVIGLEKAIEFIGDVGPEEIGKRNASLIKILESELSQFSNLQLFQSPKEKTTPISSFSVPASVSPDELAALLSANASVFVRGGHHCAHPMHKYLKSNGSIRASMQFYNTETEIEKFLKALKEVLSIAVPRRGLSR